MLNVLDTMDSVQATKLLPPVSCFNGAHFMHRGISILEQIPETENCSAIAFKDILYNCKLQTS